jgi:general secretion pathway protein C
MRIENINPNRIKTTTTSIKVNPEENLFRMLLQILFIVLPLVVFGTGIFFLIFTISILPIDYKFPKQIRNSQIWINTVKLEKNFLKFFHHNEQKSLTVENRNFVKIPSPLEIKSFLQIGNVTSVILKAGKETLILISNQTQNGWTLLGVKGDKVLLLYKNRKVELSIPTPKVSNRVDMLQRKINKNQKKEMFKTISRETVISLMQNYAELLKGIDFRPYTKNGKTIGFQIRYLNPSSIFYKLGFRIGDIITSVNDVHLKNTEDLFQIIQIIQNEPNVRIKIIRNGKPMTLNIRIE